MKVVTYISKNGVTDYQTQVDTADWGLFGSLPDTILRKIEDEIEIINKAEFCIMMASTFVTKQYKDPREHFIKKYRNMHH